MPPFPLPDMINLVDRLDCLRANVVDIVSFGFVNVMQARHGLPEDFAERFTAYTTEWEKRSVTEYYEIPKDFVRPAFPGEGRLQFRSPIQGEFEANNIACFDLFPCARGWSAPTMILAHGLMSVSDFGYRLWAKRLNARGWNAVFAHLPYHYSRRVPGYLYGEMAVGPNLLRTAEGIRQSVIECRVMMDLLESAGGRLFGGWGTSYGGWITALLACFEPRLQRCILVEPILDIEAAIWHSPASVTLRRGLRKRGITPENTKTHLRYVCPRLQTPSIEGRHAIMLAGEWDRIAPPAQIEGLHKQWTGSHYRCSKQGHVGYTLMPESFRLAQQLWADDFEPLDAAAGERAADDGCETAA